MKGAEAVLACLRAEGIEYIFGNPGTTEIPLLDALSAAPDIRYLIALQESVAVGMADGYARSGGRIGFVSVHTGAGTSNAIGGIYNAFIENVPLVVTAGYKDTRLHGRECFSEVPDFPGMTRQFTKSSRQVLRTDKVAEEMLRAVKTALTPPAGPVFLSLPEDLMDQEGEQGEILSHVPRTPLTFSGDREGVKKAARLLARARSPLFIAGNEIAASGAMAEAVKLADMLGTPVMTEGRSALTSLNFPHTHPFFRGMFEPSSPSAVKADVVIGIGCRMFTQSVYHEKPDLPPEAKIIHFHSNPHEIARLYPEEVSVVTDAKKGIAMLIDALKPLLKGDRTVRERRLSLIREQEDMEEEKRREIQAAWDKTPIALPRLVMEMQETLETDAVIVDEAITSSRALLKYYPFERPGTYHRSSAGVLGWGVPAALGVKLANPDRQVVAFVGDGSFIFSVQSLWTAARYNIPVVVIVCKNRLYRAVKDAALRYGGISARTGHYIGADIDSPEIDFCRLAAGFGVWGKRIKAPRGFKPALQEALSLGKPAVLEINLR